MKTSLSFFISVLADPTLGFNAGLSAKKGVKFELVDASGKVVDKFIRGTGDWAYAAPTLSTANGEKTGDIEGYNK